MRTLFSTDPACLASSRGPAVPPPASGRPLPSLTTCTFVPKPPRERPRAWSAGSPGGGFFFPGPRGGAGGADIAAVDAEQVRVDQPGLVQVELQPLDDLVQQPAPAELGEA